MSFSTWRDLTQSDILWGWIHLSLWRLDKWLFWWARRAGPGTLCKVQHSHWATIWLGHGSATKTSLAAGWNSSAVVADVIHKLVSAFCSLWDGVKTWPYFIQVLFHLATPHLALRVLGPPETLQTRIWEALMRDQGPTLGLMALLLLVVRNHLYLHFSLWEGQFGNFTRDIKHTVCLMDIWTFGKEEIVLTIQHWIALLHLRDRQTDRQACTHTQERSNFRCQFLNCLCFACFIVSVQDKINFVDIVLLY